MITNFAPMNPKIANFTAHPVKIFWPEAVRADRSKKRYNQDTSFENPLKVIVPITGKPLQVRPSNDSSILGYAAGIPIVGNDFAKRIEIPHNFLQYDIIIVSEFYARAAASACIDPRLLDRLYVPEALVYEGEKVVGCRGIRHYMTFFSDQWYKLGQGASKFSEFLGQNQRFSF